MCQLMSINAAQAITNSTEITIPMHSIQSSTQYHPRDPCNESGYHHWCEDTMLWDGITTCRRLRISGSLRKPALYVRSGWSYLFSDKRDPLSQVNFRLQNKNAIECSPDQKLVVITLRQIPLHFNYLFYDLRLGIHQFSVVKRWPRLI